MRVAFLEGDDQGEGGGVEPLVPLGFLRAPAGLGGDGSLSGCAPVFVSVIVLLLDVSPFTLQK